MLSAVLLLAAVTSHAPAIESSTLQSMLAEESPDVFLAKAALEQYLSRVVQKDWDGARRLTHPKTLSLVGALKRRGVRHVLAPWNDPDARLQNFRLGAAREVSPGIVLVAAGEQISGRADDTDKIEQHAVYVLFKSRRGFLIADRKPATDLAAVTDGSVRSGYRGYLDQQVQAQARRESALFEGRHR
jgi:hypothetical protein